MKSDSKRTLTGCILSMTASFSYGQPSHASRICFTLFLTKSFFSSSSGIGDRIKPTDCRAMLIMDIICSTRFFQEWYKGVHTATSMSKNFSRKRRISTSFVARNDVLLSGPPSVYKHKICFSSMPQDETT